MRQGLIDVLGRSFPLSRVGGCRAISVNERGDDMCIRNYYEELR